MRINQAISPSLCFVWSGSFLNAERARLHYRAHEFLFREITGKNGKHDNALLLAIISTFYQHVQLAQSNAMQRVFAELERPKIFFFSPLSTAHAPTPGAFGGQLQVLGLFSFPSWHSA